MRKNTRSFLNKGLLLSSDVPHQKYAGWRQNSDNDVWSRLAVSWCDVRKISFWRITGSVTKTEEEWRSNIFLTKALVTGSDEVLFFLSNHTWQSYVYVSSLNNSVSCYEEKLIPFLSVYTLRNEVGFSSQQSNLFAQWYTWEMSPCIVTGQKNENPNIFVTDSHRKYVFPFLFLSSWR